MSLIVDTTMQAIQSGLDLRERREQLLASNIANVDTPLFTPMELENEGAVEAIRRESSWGRLAMRRTAEGHLATHGSDIVANAEPIERPDATSSLDHNRVDLDSQVAKFADNAVKLSATAEIARRRFALTNYAISRMSGGA